MRTLVGAVPVELCTLSTSSAEIVWTIFKVWNTISISSIWFHRGGPRKYQTARIFLQMGPYFGSFGLYSHGFWANITHKPISKCNYIQQVTHNNTSFLLQIQESTSYLDSIQKREANAGSTSWRILFISAAHCYLCTCSLVSFLNSDNMIQIKIDLSELQQ